MELLAELQWSYWQSYNGATGRATMELLAELQWSYWQSYSGATGRATVELLAVLHTQGHTVPFYLTLKMTAPQYFETAETVCPSTQH
jgi:hypothetical protein